MGRGFAVVVDRRAKTQTGRNEIKIYRNETQIQRNKIQI
jgi:hypothetical protein